MPLLSSTHCPRNPTATAHSLCNCSETTSPSGLLRIAESLTPLLRHPRRPRRLRSPRQRSQRQKLRPPLNLRSLTLGSRLFFIRFLILLEWLIYLAGWLGDLSMGRGWELIWKAERVRLCEFVLFANTPSCVYFMIMFSVLVAMFSFPAIFLHDH